jgi:hypothetical protein
MCEGEIELGSVSVHGTIWGFVFVGMSYQHCWFEGIGTKEQVVLGSRLRRSGMRCKACGFVGMYGDARVM